MKHIYISKSSQETKDIGFEMAKNLQAGSILCFSGDLGAGKTTLTQGILAGLGAPGPYTSPTFVIMKEYSLPKATVTGIRRVYHIDAYRVEAKDIEHLGFEEWCSDLHGVVILEWPERVRELLPEKRIDIILNQKGEQEREIVMYTK